MSIRPFQKKLIHRCFPILSGIHDSREYHRRRLQVAVSSIAFVFCTIMGFVCWKVGLGYTPIILFSSSFLCVLTFLMLRIGREAAIWLSFVMLGGMMSVWVCIWETGFWQGSVLAWLTIGPVAAMLFFKKAARPLLWANALFAFVLFWLWQSGVDLPNQLGPDATAMFSTVNGIALMFMIFWFANEMTENRTEAYRDLRKSKEALAEAMAQLKSTESQLVHAEKMAALGELTAGIAHEINNPINFVSGNLMPLRRDIDALLELLHQYETVVAGAHDEIGIEMAKLKEKMDFDYTVEEIGFLLNGIEEGARRTTEIVKGLRNFSRLDESELKKANLCECLDSTLVLLNSQIKKGNIVLEKNFDHLPDLMCYPGQLNQVFLNIITNAIHAMPKTGGKIIVQAKHLEHEKAALICVSDNGHGMTEAVLNKIFNPFFTTKEVGEGTGLGLSISFGIIQKHKGRIWAASRVGEGTTFFIQLNLVNE